MKPRKPFWDNLITMSVYVLLNGFKFAYFGLALILLKPKRK